MSGLGSLRVLVSLPLAAVVVTLTVVPLRTSEAVFHFSVIDEVMTSYDGDTAVQFVEINMLLSGQNVVANTVLAAFDDSGSYLGDVLVVPQNVPSSGSGVRWIMGTSQFETVSGLAPDFIMPAGLPTGGGMVCWGGPVDHTNPAQYVDCVAYGTYSGPSNVHVGTPTSLDADGHSLQRTQDTANNAADFACGDPASPTNNAGSSASLAATVSCSAATATPAPTPTSTPTPTPGPVGGIAELPAVAGTPLEAGGSSGPSANVVAGVAAAVAAGALALGGAAWYARRRVTR